MHCGSCGSENAAGAKFCEECGTPFVRLCPSCGQQMRPAAKFCPECGTPLQAIGKPKPAKRRKSATPSGRISRPAARSAASRPRTAVPEAERRQLTVMFCDLVGSTALSAQLDPEALREVIRAYQQTSAEVIDRLEGHIAQYLGDGLLVYFGYPAAHEDDAARTVRAGLRIIEALHTLNTHRTRPLQVRIGIHTGLVVIGEMGGGHRQEQLALGETPNLAARIQGHAAPDEVIISAATYRLVEGLFACEDRGQPELKGVATPLTLYRVVKEEEAQSRFEVGARKGLTPLVGREHEFGLLRERWERVKGGTGQVVLLSGEPGIGKSRLMYDLKEQTGSEAATRIAFHCSPYHQNSALYPVIDHLQRLLQWRPEERAETKLEQLRRTLAQYRFPQPDTLPLLAALLSLPHPADVPPLTLSPQKQKQRTQEALVAWLVEEAQRQAVYCVWEDLHWIDPSTLEVLTLLLEQVATTRLLVLLTFRPEFLPPWRSSAHLTQLTLTRLGQQPVEAMVTEVAGGKALPREVVRQIVAKTDGVPLFVEELTKTVVESGLLTAINNHYELKGPLPPLAIPSTLHDSLMARLDRLSTVKEIAQLGATIGREFSYELLAAVSLFDEGTLQQGLQQLVGVELVYQSGGMPQARYLFKHALIQDTAYQSLLMSTRQQYHTKIAQVLAEGFPETVETQPELIAHHYTEAGLIGQAIPYWQKAGERAIQRSAYVEAVVHGTRGLELLKTLPDTSERIQQELYLQLSLGAALFAVKGYTAPGVEKTYSRARELCQQLGESPQLFPVLWSLVVFYNNRAEYRTSRELAEQLLGLARRVHDQKLLSSAHGVLGWTLYSLGEITSARTLLEQGLALYDPQHPPGRDNPRVVCLSYASWTLWQLGYPDQGLQRSKEAVDVARGLSNHPFSLAYTLAHAARFYLLRREGALARERAEEVMTLSTEQGFPFWLAFGTRARGAALAEQGEMGEGIAQMQEGLAALRSLGTEAARAIYLADLAVAYAKVGRVEEGLVLLVEALAHVDKTGGRVWEAEMYRLKGELTLQHSSCGNPEASIRREAEACFHKAIEITRQQQAKSLELRATVSFARLWQQQGKQAEAHTMLSEIYGWFTEGFDTRDLREAKALLDELGESL